LYGRSTFAGAINYVTRKPSDEFYSEVEVTGAQDSEYRVMGIVSGPLINETLSGRFAAGYETDDGTYSNSGSSGGLGGYENTHLMGTLRFTPSDSVEILLDGAWSDLETNSAALGRYSNNCGINQAPSQDTLFYSCGKITGAKSTDELGLSSPAYSMDGDQARVNLTVNIDFEPFTFSSITAWNHTDQDSFADLDRTAGGEIRWGHIANVPEAVWEEGQVPGAPVQTCLACFRNPARINDFRDPQADPNGEWSQLPTYFNENSNGDSKYLSQEFRLTSPGDQRVRWMAGVFGFHQETQNQTGLTVDISSVMDFLSPDYADGDFIFFDEYSGLWLRSDFTPSNVFIDGAEQNIVQSSDKDTTQLAVFGSVNYDVNDRVTFTGELRYTYEDRELTDNFDAFFGDGSQLNNKYTSRDTFLDPRFSFQLQASDTKMFYISAAQGTRSGDCNPGELPFTQQQLDEFKCYDPESNWTYELGGRTDWLDNTLRFNMTFFYVDWEDVQFRTQIPELGNLSTITTNLGELTSYGAEMDANWLLTDRLSASLGYGFSDPKFDDDEMLLDFGTSPLCSSGAIDASKCFSNPADPGNSRRYVDIAGNQLRRTSRHTFNAGLQYTDTLVAEWDWYTRWDYRYQSKQYQEMHNEIWTPSMQIVDARIGTRNDNLDVSFWVRNLTDETTPLSAYAFQSDLNNSDYATTVVNRERRRFGVTANYHF
jgi:iron complex outermembrane receptor protein